MAFDLKSLQEKNAKPEPVRRRKALPLIGHLDIDTQFRILGTVFVVCMLITIAAIFAQSQATTHGVAHLALSSRIAALTQQIPKAALNAMQGQAGSFAELRASRDAFRQHMERLNAGMDDRGFSLTSVGPDVRSAFDTVREGWIKQDAIIDQLLGQETRFAAIGRLATEATQQAQAMSETADAVGGKLPVLTERILRTAGQMAAASSPRACA
jgi:methyl-accepting chemotaxis protein